jgi:superfamily II DNA/RNA helicase
VAARGIDVENITHVINYDIPMEKESYVHRIGRTARAGKQGIAITFVSQNEYRFLREIEEYVGLSIEKGEMPSEEEVEKGKQIFSESDNVKSILKNDRNAELNKEIIKVYINAGKKKKIRAGDIVGAITSIKGVNAENIGVIDIQDNFSYVDILDGKGKLVIESLQQTLIKGKNVRVQKAQK